MDVDHNLFQSEGVGTINISNATNCRMHCKIFSLVAIMSLPYTDSDSSYANYDALNAMYIILSLTKLYAMFEFIDSCVKTATLAAFFTPFTNFVTNENYSISTMTCYLILQICYLIWINSIEQTVKLFIAHPN